MSATTIASREDGSKALLQEDKLVFIWSVTTLLVVMNTTMFNVALPSILKDFSLSSSTASWLVSGYSIMFALSTLAFSRLSDFIPIRRLLLYGLTIMGVASLVGFFASNFALLLGARIVQAAGGGASAGLGMVMAGRYIPVERRGKAMAIIASGAALAFGLGPVIGGVVTEYLGWHYLFAVTGMAVLSIPFFMKLLPEEKKIEKGRFDFLGALLTALSVTGLLVFLSTFSYWILLVTAVLFVLWWKYLNWIEQPFILPTLLRNKQYVKLLFIGCTAFFLNFANLFLMPLILTGAFGKSPAEVGMLIFPGAVLAVIAGQFIGRVIDRFGTVPVTAFGLLSLLSATLLFAGTATKSPYFILFTYMFASIGFTSLSTSVSNEATRILPSAEIGSALGIVQLVQFFGGGIGVTVSGLLLTLQADIALTVVYRNIYLCFAVLILTAMTVFGLYYRKVKSQHVVK